MPSRYKAKIAGVEPPSRRAEFEQEAACFLGVSLENQQFSTAKVSAMAEWVSRRFARCTVLVGDSIHRITLAATRSMPEPAATAEALRLGAEFIERNRQVFEEFGSSVQFEFLTCGEVQAWGDYHRYHAELVELFDSDQAFRDSVREFGEAYHARRDEGLTNVEQERRIGLSCAYFLEEFAVFACLKRRGIGVMVYPGSFSTLAELAGGSHPEAPAELRELTVVSLQLKGR
ncbi:tRNA-dependent cyclodipeptide synthase [Kitasatospora sp. MAP5-34]|uniref:tRNA-dependent cyclodipeptide synthase n=1 Tax=Kitasatospora sp. MAP5-34 TaxID=3035102 RepID=UPI002473735D|nr:tRNA-dependent cyclodipeptide synthase [Kitasatospora sp. MAP5-34]MDH6575314.1 tRNA-dependent cyclodipeptide synthase [Kitasatospora sp. MAP5-34]